MQGFALNNISDCYIGSNQVSAIYLGNVKIWPTTPPQPHDYSRDYLTFEALEPTSFSFTQNDLQYSLDDGSTWTTLTAGNSTPQLSTGNKILWKQTGLTSSSSNPRGIGTFSATGNFNACGNIMSLYYGDNFIGQESTRLQTYAFYSLFENCNKILNTNNLILPTTYLNMSCYSRMFYNCTSLITSPTILPAITADDYCYSHMFYNCTSLTTAPTLPATSLDAYCYSHMFYNCTSLTTAPTLPATSTSSQCYNGMFQGCTSLTTAPSTLPATGIGYLSYAYMFYGCTSLTTAPEILATVMDDSSCYYMFYGCTSLTIAPSILRPTTITRECYYHMFQNCTSLTTAPELPASQLNVYCYEGMFSGCTSLNYIKCLATTGLNNTNLSGWVYNVSPTGTFVKDASVTWPTGGIPSGWTIINA